MVNLLKYGLICGSKFKTFFLKVMKFGCETLFGAKTTLKERK